MLTGSSLGPVGTAVTANFGTAPESGFISITGVDPDDPDPPRSYAATGCEVTHADAELIIKQGDQTNHQFYIIKEGRVVCTRAEGEGEEPKVVLKLKAGQYFGERALLKNQTRYAGIRAKSARLHTMCITREDFERSLGCKLEVRRYPPGVSESAPPPSIPLFPLIRYPACHPK